MFEDAAEEKEESRRSKKERKEERKELKREMGVLVCGVRAVLLHSSFESYSDASCDLGVTEAGWLLLS